MYSRALWYNKSSFLHKSKSYNKEIGKLDESLGRKAIGPVKWQPVAEIVGTVCLAVFFCFETT